MTRHLPDTIKIKTHRREDGKEITETEEVPAKIVGQLAFREDGKRWRGRERKPPQQLYSITHVASGLRIMDELTLSEVRAAIKRMQEIDWSKPCFMGEGGYNTDPEAFKAAIELRNKVYAEVRK